MYELARKMEIERLRDFIINLLRYVHRQNQIKGKQSDIQIQFKLQVYRQICRKIISYQYFKIKLVQYTCNCSSYLSGHLHIFLKMSSKRSLLLLSNSTLHPTGYLEYAKEHICDFLHSHNVSKVRFISSSFDVLKALCR
mgnify:CR=1 FL=1